MSYTKKLNELDRQVDRFGVDEDFCRELCKLSEKIQEKYPIGAQALHEYTVSFKNQGGINIIMFINLMDKCRTHLKNF